MEGKAQFLCAIVVFIGLISQGWCQCSLDDIKIKQDTTGRVVGGKQEWLVTITNKCECAQTGLKLDCDGLQTTEKPDPNYVIVAGAICLLYQPIPPSSSINFTYAWDSAFTFTPLFSQLSCS